jgi:hypothetical protein
MEGTVPPTPAPKGRHIIAPDVSPGRAKGLGAGPHTRILTPGSTAKRAAKKGLPHSPRFSASGHHGPVEKLRYMHRKAVIRGLVLAPEQWARGPSFRASCERVGILDALESRGKAAGRFLNPAVGH